MVTTLTVEDDKIGRPRFRRWRDRQATGGAAPPMRSAALSRSSIGPKPDPAFLPYRPALAVFWTFQTRITKLHRGPTTPRSETRLTMHHDLQRG
jgi:hypothetical protein